MRRLLLTTSLASLLSLTATAAELEPLKPRVEMEWRPGQDRSILQTELWMPMAQDRDSVLYGDIRVMGDQHDNREFNVGVGYREIVDAHALGKGVVGVHGWFDRRVTENHSRFNQVTLGTEWMGEMVDVKLNVYIPLNDSNLVQRQNPNGTGARLVGSQIFVNTDQVVSEEAMKGVDLEFGVRVPFMDDETDATRVYVAGYHFEGDKAEDVTGYRTRFTSDLTEDVSIGARYQHDDVRGSQGFLEATVRFPFGNKKSYQEEGLRARLDESPERDIDIVTNDAIIAGAEPVALTNTTTGTTQTIIHVDNTNTGGAGGNGTAEDPFSTLAAAEGAADDNDIIYVHRGTGDTTGMSDGIAIDNVKQQLIGSGADLTFDATKFGTANGLGISDLTLIKANPLGAPVITNGTGNGVYVTADGVTLSGLTVDGANTSGVRFTDTSNILIERMNIINSGSHGIFFISNSTDGSFEIRDNLIDLSNGRGVYISALTNSSQTIRMVGNVISNGTDEGAFFITTGNSVQDVTMMSNTIQSNANRGVVFSESSNTKQRGILESNVIKNNANGLEWFTTDNAYQEFSVSNNFFLNNIGYGVRVNSQVGSSKSISFSGNEIINNTSYGILINDGSTRDSVIDFGGGILGSTGGNSINDNAGVEISVDLDGGELKAENNYWGSATGLAVSERFLDPANGGSTIDADPFLTSAP